ncbi:hypothetical protein [Streptomyces sp. Tue6028]
MPPPSRTEPEHGTTVPYGSAHPTIVPHGAAHPTTVGTARRA